MRKPTVNQELQNTLLFLEETPQFITMLAQNLSTRELMRKPGIAEFSLLEHVCHLRDIEVEGYEQRIDRLLNQDRPYLHDIDGNKLAKERDYNNQIFDQALSAFTKARNGNIRTIRTLERHHLERCGILQNVGIITLGQLVVMMREHDEGHRLLLSRLCSEP